MCAAAADLERMSDKLPLAKLGTAAVYSCGKLALLDEPGCDVNTYDMRLPAEKAAATCAKPACKDAMHMQQHYCLLPVDTGQSVNHARAHTQVAQKSVVINLEGMQYGQQQCKPKQYIQ